MIKFQHQLIFYSLLTLVLSPLLLLPKGQIVYNFNLFEFPYFFNFFKYITYLGDGIFIPILLILFFFISKKRKRNFRLISFIISCILMVIIVWSLKHLIFDDLSRPFNFFVSKPESWLINDFNLSFHKHKTFPSGHTATATIFGLYLMEFTQNKFKKFFIYLMILLVGASRIYLFQHFFIDVFIGFYIGFLSVSLSRIILLHNLKSKIKKYFIPNFQ